jgi:hypothetical protein
MYKYKTFFAVNKNYIVAQIVNTEQVQQYIYLFFLFIFFISMHAPLL